MSELVEGALPEIIHEHGIELPDDMSFEGWLATAQYVRTAEKGWQWWLADLVLWADTHGLENQAVQALDDLGFAPHTLSNKKWVASRIPLARRREALSFDHHAAVSGLEPADADALLERAILEQWSRDELRHAVRRLQQTTATPEQPAPRRHPGPQGRRTARLSAPREVRELQLEPAAEIDLLLACQEALDRLADFGRVVQAAAVTPDGIYVAAAKAKDLLLEIMETCERLGVEPL